MSFIEKVVKAYKSDDLEAAYKIFGDRIQEFMQILGSAIHPEPCEVLLLCAAHKLIGEALYSTLSKNDKELCDAMVSRAHVITIMDERGADDEV